MKVFSVANFNSKRLNTKFEHFLGNFFLTYMASNMQSLFS